MPILGELLREVRQILPENDSRERAPDRAGARKILILVVFGVSSCLRANARADRIKVCRVSLEHCRPIDRHRRTFS